MCRVFILIALMLPTGQRLAAEDLAGRVLFEGKPAANITVYVVRKTWPNNRYRQDAMKAQTDADGRFRFADFHRPGGRVIALVSVCQEGRLLTSKYLQSAKGKPFADVELQVRPAGTTILELRDSSGEPIRNAAVRPRARRSGREQNMIYDISLRHLTHRTDSNGTVRLSYFEPGDRVTVSVNGRQVHFVVSDANPIRVTVKDPPVARPRALRWPKPTPADPAHVAWVRENTVRFRSLDAADEDFDDLAGVGRMIGDRRIVMLGEQTHGDGTCFRTKVRLIKYMHQELGFDVIAFESGLFDCREAWQEFRNPETPVLQAAQTGVFGIWTGSRQVRPLFDYIRKQAAGSRPLELAGVDCQFTGRASRRFVTMLREIAGRLEPDVVSDQELQEVCDVLDLLVAGKPTVGSLRDFEATMSRLIEAIEAAGDDREMRFFGQALRSVKAQARSRQVRDPAMRDAQMARNLVWLAREYYPKRKIIVWAASFHTMRNPASVRVPASRISYEKTKTMGHLAHPELGKDVFSVMFTAHRGSAGAWMRRPAALPIAPAGTLEDVFEKAGIQNGMLSLRSSEPGAAWLQQPLAARPLGYQYMQADWSRVFDAVIFNETMTPSTRK